MDHFQCQTYGTPDNLINEVIINHIILLMIIVTNTIQLQSHIWKWWWKKYVKKLTYSLIKHNMGDLRPLRWSITLCKKTFLLFCIDHSLNFIIDCAVYNIGHENMLLVVSIPLKQYFIDMTNKIKVPKVKGDDDIIASPY